MSENGPPVSATERFAVRFAATFGANVIRSGLSFVSGLLVARGLGAAAYGDLSFLLGGFAAMSSLLEMGTSSAFYTFISRKSRGRTFFVLYGAWMVTQFVFIVVAISLVLPADAIARIWVGHERGIVLLAFGASFLMTQSFGMVRQLGEAIRKTVLVQSAAIVPALVHLALVSAAVFGGWLTIEAVMWLRVGEYGLFVAVLGPRLLRANVATSSESDEDAKVVIGQFARYCAPLVVYAWVGFLYAFADRWLLQHFGGAEQQGFFSIGRQFSNISLLATTSIVAAFWKEIAAARERGDRERLQKLYRSVSRGLYFASAWVSWMLIPYSSDILHWTLGPSYGAASLALALMFLFPIHQSLGQIAGVFWYASGDTASYTKVGLIMMLVSIPITYVMLAPGSLAVPGLGFGAVGLAAKMVVLQIIGVNVQAYMIARSNGWSLAYGYGYQAVVLALLGGLAFLAKWGAGVGLAVSPFQGGARSTMLVGVVIYILLSIILLSSRISLVGLTWEEIRFFLKDLRSAARLKAR